MVVGSGGSWEAVQVAGGMQLIVGFTAMLAGAWDGERSADTWQWLVVCLSVDLLLGAGAVALAAVPIIALEVMALTLDLAKAGRKVVARRSVIAAREIHLPSDVPPSPPAHAQAAH
jgi:hypothetical protein